MLRKLPVVTETPFIPGRQGQAAYSWCPPPTPPPPPPPPPDPAFAALPGVKWDASGCWIDWKVFWAALEAKGISGILLPSECVFYNLPPRNPVPVDLGGDFT